MSEKESKKHLQIKKANDVLLELKPNISTEDREAAENVLDLGVNTVNRYLTGKAKKLDIALKLIKFFKQRIKEREQEFADQTHL